jgi:hypothetical protein
MDAWAQYLWARDRQCVFEYLSIIVTPGAGGLGPEFHGFVTHGERGRYVCQPAVLRDRMGLLLITFGKRRTGCSGRSGQCRPVALLMG